MSKKKKKYACLVFLCSNATIYFWNFRCWRWWSCEYWDFRVKSASWSFYHWYYYNNLRSFRKICLIEKTNIIFADPSCMRFYHVVNQYENAFIYINVPFFFFVCVWYALFVWVSLSFHRVCSFSYSSILISCLNGKTFKAWGDFTR